MVTGFGPFGGEAINPSGEIARQLHGTVIAGHRVTGALLPCVFGEAITELRKQIRATKPLLVICVGQAGGRTEITPERVAINVDDARIADNAGRQPVDRPVRRGGPAAYWSTLPIKAIVQQLGADLAREQAVLQSSRTELIIVVVRQWPCGALASRRRPRGARPRRRVMFVFAADSSRKTSLAGSRPPWPRRHRRRARTMSGRSCSAARRVFF